MLAVKLVAYKLFIVPISAINLFANMLQEAIYIQTKNAGLKNSQIRNTFDFVSDIHLQHHCTLFILTQLVDLNSKHVFINDFYTHLLTHIT